MKGFLQTARTYGVALDSRRSIATLRPVRKGFPALPQACVSHAGHSSEPRLSPAQFDIANRPKGKAIRLKKRVISPEVKLQKSSKGKSSKGTLSALGRLAAYQDEIIVLRQAWFSSRRALLQLLKKKLKGKTLDSVVGELKERWTAREMGEKLGRAGIRVQKCVLDGLATEGYIDINALLLELKQADVLPSRPKPLLSLTQLPAIHLYNSHYDKSISDREGFFSLSPGQHFLQTDRSNEEAFHTEQDMTVSAQGSPFVPGRPKSLSSSNSSNLVRE